MLSQKRGEGKKRCKEFVERAIGRNDRDPLKEVFGGSILRGKTFVKEASGGL